ncbi:MAG: 4'-phosphopantetheinyl transferase superfamily protein [Bacteroidetes bacterium]|nr:4'-phosphopantetheinyl transferase superfamily protein [Bacteroidota bacterium]
MTEVVYTRIDAEMPLPEMPGHLNGLSSEKLERYHSLHRQDDRKRMLAGDLVLRTTLAKKLRCDPSSVTFLSQRHGKPILAGIKGIHFNLSHSGNYAVAVISSSEAGIDIEEIRTLKEPGKIAEVFMSEKEFACYSNLPEELRQKWFYRIWTAKESYIKQTGNGIFEGLKSVTIDFSGPRILAYKNNKPLSALFFHEIDIDPGYCAFVCSEDQTCSDPAGFHLKNELHKEKGMNFFTTQVIGDVVRSSII